MTTCTVTWEDIINGKIPDDAARHPDGTVQIAGFWEHGADEVRGWSGKRFVTVEERRAENAIYNAKFDAIRAELVEQFGDPAIDEDADRDAFYRVLGKRTRWIRIGDEEVRAYLEAPPPGERFTPELPVDYPEDLRPPNAPAWQNPEAYAHVVYWFGEREPGKRAWLRLDAYPVPAELVRAPAVRWDLRRSRWERFWLYAEMSRQAPPAPEPGILDIDVARRLNLSVEDLIGVSAAVLGIRGGGKTNTAAVLVEELLAAGVPMTIVDPEGEYWSLKERFDVLVAGRSEHADLPVGVEGAAALADFSVRKRVPVVLDLDGFRRAEMDEFLLAYFRALWEAADAVRRPYQVLLEEAHVFVPQGKGSELKEVLVQIALRGRKRGLGIVAVSQRSAKVDKDLLSQSSILLLHRVTHPTDLNVYKELVPMKPAEIHRKIPALEPGQVCALVDHEPHVVRVRRRHTFHAGATPGLRTDTPPALRKIDAALLEELRRAVAGEAAQQVA